MTTTTNYIFPKEYFKYVNRFLKEVGLYSEWIRFLYFNPKNGVPGCRSAHTNWTTKGKYSLVDVLGSTNFTDFLRLCCDKKLPDDICSFELFAAFLYHFYPSVLTQDEEFMVTNGSFIHYLIVNQEVKKVRIRWK